MSKPKIYLWLLSFLIPDKDVQRRRLEEAPRAFTVRTTEQPIGTSTAAGKCFLDMLGAFAEFETNLWKERQLEGIAKAKAAGVYAGRWPSIDAAKVRELKPTGRPASTTGHPSLGSTR